MSEIDKDFKDYDKQPNIIIATLGNPANGKTSLGSSLRQQRRPSSSLENHGLITSESNSESNIESNSKRKLRSQLLSKFRSMPRSESTFSSIPGSPGTPLGSEFGSFRRGLPTGPTRETSAVRPTGRPTSTPDSD